MLSIPGNCWLCQRALYITCHGICSACLRALPPLPPCCPRCGLPAGSETRSCGRCQQKPPPWRQLISVSDYIPPLNLLVQQLKFHGNTALSVMLARLLLLSFLARRNAHRLARPDMLLCVPLHRWRIWRRGYNQSDLLAASLARWLNIDYRPNAILRSTSGPPQHHLTAHQRQHNLRAAFQLTMSVQDRHIALIDDVVTTGSTAAEITRLLLRHGASNVQVWCICRTL